MALVLNANTRSNARMLPEYENEMELSQEDGALNFGMVLLHTITSLLLFAVFPSHSNVTFAKE